MLDQKSQPLWLRFSPHIIAQVGITALAVAYYAEIIHALEPCILCIYQRVPFVLVIAFGLAGMFRPALLYWMLVFAGVAFLTGSGIATYHVGVEQHWWESACGGDLGEQMSTTNLIQRLSMKPVKSCDELEWALFGISMATYNVFHSLALSIFCFAGVHKLRG